MSRPGEERLRAFLEERTGFAIPQDRWEFLAPRFLDRTRARGFTVADYVRYLEVDPLGRRELEEIFNVLTVRKTSFFRNPASFAALEEVVLPRLREAREGAGPVSIWSAGCASGEEPYSVAMVARAVFGRAEGSHYILGTDIAREALATAREGSYPAASLEAVPERFRKHARVLGGRLWVREDVRRALEFVSHNLVHDPAPRAAAGAWDVILCRNVLIYFGLAQAREVVERFAQLLTPGGCLFLGHAEVLTGLDSLFEVVFHGDTFFYRRRPKAQVRPPAPGRSTAPAAAPTTEGADTRVLNRLEAHRRETRSLARPRRRRGVGLGRSDPGAFHDAPTDVFRRPAGLGQTPTRAFDRAVAAAGPTDDDTRADERPAAVSPQEELLQASVRLDGGDLDGAARILRRTLAAEPRWAKPRVLLADVHRRLGRTAAARHELEAAVELDPLDARAHYLLGAVRAEAGEEAQAELSFRRALYLEPDYVRARYELAQTYRRSDRRPRAGRELRNVLRTLRQGDPLKLTRLTEGLGLEELTRRCERELAELGAG